MKGSKKPFHDALADLLGEQEVSQSELARRVRGRGWGSKSAVNLLARGELEPTIKAMSAIAKALTVSPEYFAEYRLAVARQRLDPRAVGLATALRNLGE